MKRILCLIVLIFAAAVPAYAQTSGQVTTSRMIRISGGAYAHMTNDDFLEDLAGNSAVAGQISKDVFEADWNDLQGEINVRFSHGDPTGIYFKITLMLPRDLDIEQDKSDTFVDILMAQLLAILVENHEQLTNQELNKLQQADERVIEATQKVKEIQAVLSKLRRENVGEVLPYNDVMEAQRSAKESLRDIEMDLEVVSATQSALTQRIAQIAEQAGALDETDEISIQLRELLELKERSLANVVRLMESGQASQDEVNKFRAEMIQTRIEIARRRESLNRDHVGDRLAKLNAQLDELLVTSTRLEAMHGMALARADEMLGRDLIGLADKHEALQVELKTARRELADRQQQLHKQRSMVEELEKPQIVVIQ